MRRHGDRQVYYFLGEEQPVVEPAYLSGGIAPVPSDDKSSLLFGRLFKRNDPKDAAEAELMVQKLIALGCIMSDPPGNVPPDTGDDSGIPSGYTYLGQFIAHEVTFNNTQDLPLTAQELPVNCRSPQIDLDSLYGVRVGGERDPRMYEPADDAGLKVGASLKVGSTVAVPGANYSYPNDLFREPRDAAHLGEAIVGDPRNDENLPLAQTHLALAHFHNKVVERLKAQGTPTKNLFEEARKIVVQHFQWIILEDYLPRIIDPDVLRCAREHPPYWYEGGTVFMPIEFSAAAFRIGHSMVRGSYDWNTYHSDQPYHGGRANLAQLFEFTKFSGDLAGRPGVPSDWVIDWRRFYDFDHLSGYEAVDAAYRNRARKIDTQFSLRIQNIQLYPQQKIDVHLRAITIRNLLRGYSFGLPTGEQVAEAFGVKPLTPEEVRTGLHEQVLADPMFSERTPLWYYILKEAELNGGGKLGPVGSRIIAETFVALIKESPYSILREQNWRPEPEWCQPGGDAPRFEMADLINAAGVVDPIGEHLKKLYPNNP
ncbi:MAG: heme peroxidase family protein [Acidobacteriota bacterium]|nr:heme peroxidase family protein [Acidobacteriota bacterium]